MLKYDADLKYKARRLRKNMTDSERMLWSHLRGKQILNIQFYRQKPIGKYIVDFYAPRTKLVVEVDGSQHKEEIHAVKDVRRDEYLSECGLNVLRFNCRKVIKEIDAVLEIIRRTMLERLKD